MYKTLREMALIKLTLTEDMLKLISNIHFGTLPDPLEDNDMRERVVYGIDYAEFYGDGFLFEKIALILGKYFEYIPGTEEDPDGAKYSKELTDYMWEIHSYIQENIDLIEELVHQFCNKGGLMPGTYVCKPYDHLWKLKSVL